MSVAPTHIHAIGIRPATRGSTGFALVQAPLDKVRAEDVKLIQAGQCSPTATNIARAVDEMIEALHSTCVPTVVFDQRRQPKAEEIRSTEMWLEEINHRGWEAGFCFAHRWRAALLDGYKSSWTNTKTRYAVLGLVSRTLKTRVRWSSGVTAEAILVAAWAAENVRR